MSSGDNIEVLAGVSEKLNGLDLTETESEALASIVVRSASLNEAEVWGFGREEGVAALKEKEASRVMTHPYFTASSVSFSLGISAELGAG